MGKRKAHGIEYFRKFELHVIGNQVPGMDSGRARRKTHQIGRFQRNRRNRMAEQINQERTRKMEFDFQMNSEQEIEFLKILESFNLFRILS